jgi:outer membrane immunogenic protein
MKQIVVAAAAALAFAGGSANAADLPTKAPYYKAAPGYYGWTGCYIGVAGGGAWGRSTHDLTGGAVDTGPFNVRGGLIGGTLGCNWQPASNLVLGVEGDGSWVDKKGDLPNPATPNFISETKEHWLATFRGRFGATFGQTLIYGTGGFAVGGVEALSTNTTTHVTISEDKTRTGWTAGGGIEHAFSHAWTVKLEYLYVRFNKDAYFTPPPVAGFTARDNVALNDHIVRVGINYRFGGYY